MSQSSPAGGLRNDDLLGIYCNDHLAASVGGIELLGRMIAEHGGEPYAPDLNRLREEFRQERASLRSMMAVLGLPIRQYKLAATWMAEKVARLKPNGRLLQRSPLSAVVEFEFLAPAVRGKRNVFETLREVAEVDRRLDRDELDRLIEQATRQHEWLTDKRRDVAASVFGGRSESADRAGG